MKQIISINWQLLHAFFRCYCYCIDGISNRSVSNNSINHTWREKETWRRFIFYIYGKNAFVSLSFQLNLPINCHFFPRYVMFCSRTLFILCHLNIPDCVVIVIVILILLSLYLVLLVLGSFIVFSMQFYHCIWDKKAPHNLKQNTSWLSF